MPFPNFDLETPLLAKGFSVIGVDEVGRGCLAGPLFVCAVTLKPEITAKDFSWILKLGINDSKKLFPHKRLQLKPELDKIFHYAFGASSVVAINKSGIVKATKQAIRCAVTTLITATNPTNPYLLADAFYTKYVRGIGLKNQKAIIHGDCLSITIAAASIIAKVERDAFMEKLSVQFPHYKWAQNKGYGTKDHREAIEEFGVNKHHRTLFIRKIA